MFYILVADDTGVLLVRSGLVSAGVLGEARRQVETAGGTIGERLVETGAVSDDALTDLYLQYLQVPRVSASTLARLHVGAIAALPNKMAITLRAIPISRDHNNNLMVAMSDPLNTRAVDEIASYTGARVVRAVATQMQIAWCLAHYYDHLTALGKRLLQPDSDATSEPPGTAKKATSAPRSRTASGEIRLTNATSAVTPRTPAQLTPPDLHPPRNEEDTAKIVSPHRKRPPAVQPPELEARSGEVETNPGPQPHVTSEPTIVVNLEPSAPTIVDDHAPTPQRGVFPRLHRTTHVGVPPLSGSPVEPKREPEDDWYDDDDTHEVTLPTPRHTGSFESDESTDPSWGPPGTTIPPPLRGESAELRDGESDAIPVADPDTKPLRLSRPSLTERSRPHTSSEADLARHLETATQQALELIHALESATDRDDVVTALIHHIAASHVRAGLLVSRGNELSLFSISPPGTAMSAVTLRLDRPSTLQEVIEARLPYRGPMHDPDSRSFLEAVLGACPAEILLVPIAVRERVVATLFGEHRTRHTFDDQLALVARAAGLALERILMAKRG
jgi:hypothetical protein